MELLFPGEIYDPISQNKYTILLCGYNNKNDTIVIIVGINKVFNLFILIYIKWSIRYCFICGFLHDF